MWSSLDFAPMLSSPRPELHKKSFRRLQGPSDSLLGVPVRPFCQPQIPMHGSSHRHRLRWTSQASVVTKQSLFACGGVVWDSQVDRNITDSHCPTLPEDRGWTATPSLPAMQLTLSSFLPVPSPHSPLTIIQISYISTGFSSWMLCNLATSPVWCWKKVDRASC